MVVRRTVNDMKARDADALDGMIGKPRGQLAILLGFCVQNPTCRWVLPIRDDMTERSVKKIAYTTDLRCVPMDPEMFPLCFQRKTTNGVGRHVHSGFWMLGHMSGRCSAVVGVLKNCLAQQLQNRRWV